MGKKAEAKDSKQVMMIAKAGWKQERMKKGKEKWWCCDNEGMFIRKLTKADMQ